MIMTIEFFFLMEMIGTTISFYPKKKKEAEEKNHSFIIFMEMIKYV